jgi:hypothetical protein
VKANETKCSSGIGDDQMKGKIADAVPKAMTVVPQACDHLWGENAKM